MNSSATPRYCLQAAKRTIIDLVTAALLLAQTGTIPAVVRYVDVNSANPMPPYTNWATAAGIIQDAVDAAEAGDEIVVTNGTYAKGGRAVHGTITNRVVVDKPLALRSVNGPEFTVIRGAYPFYGDEAVRCVYLTDGASLSGFTLTNGATSLIETNADRDLNGGGLWCESTNVVVFNCVVEGNLAADFGGGTYGGTFEDCTLRSNRVYSGSGAGGGSYGAMLNRCTLSGNEAGDWDAKGGGAFGGMLNHCVLTGNLAGWEGGGAHSSILNDCTLITNSAFGRGGGVDSCTLNNCTLTGNTVGGGLGALGGGGANNSTLNNCTLGRNSTEGNGGGATWSTLNSCLLTGNSASYGGAAYKATLNNCTLVGNSARYSGGGAYGDTNVPCTLNNCIIYSNAAPQAANYTPYDCILSFCCATPLPVNGVGNITSAPLFVDEANGNLRLQSNSPCINAGLNAFAPAGLDPDGNRRIAGGTVDIGAYEFRTPASRISYAWLQQYGLPADGSVDFTDPDGDGMNNWQEWRCGTDPTKALSALRLLSAAVTATNVTVTWQSVPGISYSLERATNLALPSVFTHLAAGITGQSGSTKYLDTNAVGAGPYFYRIGAEY